MFREPSNQSAYSGTEGGDSILSLRLHLFITIKQFFLEFLLLGMAWRLEALQLYLV